MWICHQIILLFCVVSFLKAQSTSPTENPECHGMTMVAKHLKTGLTAMPGIRQAHCKPNKHCTGVLCSWSGEGVLEVDLHHCTDPVSYHVFFKYPAYGANENITLHQGDDNTLVDKSPTATVKIKVTQLERTGNIITTSVVLEICLLGMCHLHPLITKQQFCVKMENCSGFNASLHHYKPCGYRPSGHPNTTAAHAKSTPTGHFNTTVSPKTKASTSPGHVNTTVSPKTKASPSSGHIETAVPETIPSSTPSGHVKTAASTVPGTPRTKPATTSGHVKTAASTVPGTPRTKPTTTSGHSKPPSSPRKSTPSDKRSDGNAAHRKGSHKGDSSGGLSAGAIVGISVACVFAILVVVGAAVYWKKYNYRYRLRAAYYNDISMCEPLYEDFGPEVA